MTPVFWIIICILLAEFLLSRWLEYLNQKNWSTSLPEELHDLYDQDEYAKAQEYHRENGRLGWLSSSFSLVLLLAILWLKGFSWLNGFVLDITADPVLQALCFFGILYIANDILSLPFSIYSTFRIEAKYGFNRMTWKTYLSDKLKGYLLTAAIGGALTAIVVWFYYYAGNLFWLYAWILTALVSLFFTMFYTTLMVPIFNKLSPLESGSLRDSIESFAQKVHFPLKNIYVMDGSRRSSKANAYFSGLGNRKSIVLYDTLIEGQEESELVAILAHEVGHYRKKHVLKGMVLSLLHTGLLLYLIGLFTGSPMLSGALSVSEPNFHIGILAFGILYSPISMLTGLLMNAMSRKHEYEADDFARENFAAAPLISALKKLSVSHLSNLQPHPTFVLFHYSHPPLLARMNNLNKHK